MDRPHTLLGWLKEHLHQQPQATASRKRAATTGSGGFRPADRFSKPAATPEPGSFAAIGPPWTICRRRLQEKSLPLTLPTSKGRLRYPESCQNNQDARKAQDEGLR